MTSLERIRTDVVGSLLRPARWKAARLAFETGKMPAEEFARVELECVRRHLRLQETVGLDVVTDGEVSRLNFQDSFGLAVSGYDAGTETMKTQEKRASNTSLTRWEIPDLAAPGTPVVHRRPTVSRLKLVRNPPLEEYRRAAPLAEKPGEGSPLRPGPGGQRVGHARPPSGYATPDALVDDVGNERRQVIHAAGDAGG